MQRMIAEQSKEIDEMQNEFATASNLMQEKHSMLSNKFNDLQEMYEGRPSRPEDLEMLKD
jgi:hypothetical protein